MDHLNRSFFFLFSFVLYVSFMCATEKSEERYSFVICIICYVCLHKCLPIQSSVQTPCGGLSKSVDKQNCSFNKNPKIMFDFWHFLTFLTFSKKIEIFWCCVTHVGLWHIYSKYLMNLIRLIIYQCTQCFQKCFFFLPTKTSKLFWITHFLNDSKVKTAASAFFLPAFRRDHFVNWIFWREPFKKKKKPKEIVEKP